MADVPVTIANKPCGGAIVYGCLHQKAGDSHVLAFAVAYLVVMKLAVVRGAEDNPVADL